VLTFCLNSTKGRGGTRASTLDWSPGQPNRDLSHPLRTPSSVERFLHLDSALPLVGHPTHRLRVGFSGNRVAKHQEQRQCILDTKAKLKHASSPEPLRGPAREVSVIHFSSQNFIQADIDGANMNLDVSERLKCTRGPSSHRPTF